MDDASFGLELSADVHCVKCRRKRKFPDKGKLGVHDRGAMVYVIDTHEPCDWNCPETHVKVKLSFKFG